MGAQALRRRAFERPDKKRSLGLIKIARGQNRGKLSSPLSLVSISFKTHNGSQLQGSPFGVTLLKTSSIG
uniref:Uncharacterized protein n=1 Tax=Anguilla anguilla TaxID=7936 RepID=A0A0E9VUT4_ANGAN